MLIYIAGPYSGTPERIERNIAQAREVAIAVWRAGHVALTPHLNTAHFEQDAGLPEERYLAGDLMMLERCDGMVLTPDWCDSKGATAEREVAERRGLPIWIYPNLPPEKLG